MCKNPIQGDDGSAARGQSGHSGITHRSPGPDIPRIRIRKGIGEAKRPEGYLPYPMIVFIAVGGSQFVSCELLAGLSLTAWEINAG